MSDELEKLSDFSEYGRGLPIRGSRPAAALPFSPLVRQAYAPQPRVRLGWAQGELLVHEVQLEPPRAVASSDSLKQVAALMQREDSDFAAVVDAGRFRGVVYIEALLECVADDQHPPNLTAILSAQIPTCSPKSALVDAVRQMMACYLRRIPVVGDGGELVGMLTLSAAAAASERDPAVRDVIEGAIGASSLFARRWR